MSATLILTPEKTRELGLNLQLIRAQYALWDDPLSVKLRQWSDQTFKSPKGERIVELATRILVDDVEEMPLEHPVMIRKHVVEQWLAEECRDCFGYWPLDEGDCQMKVHEYAEKMIQWLASFTDKPTRLGPRLRPLSQEEREREEDRMTRLSTLCTRFSLTQRERRARKHAAQIDELNRKMGAATQAMRDLNTQADQDRESARTQEQEQAKIRREELKTYYEGALGMARAQVAMADKKVEEGQKTIGAQGQRIGELEQHVANLQAEIERRQQEVHSLYVQAANRDEGICVVM